MSRTRRRFLQAAGSASIVALAGCAQSDDGSGEEMADEEMSDDEMDEGSMDDGMEDETEEDGMDDMAEPTTFTVRVENVAPTDVYGSDAATGGQVWITPGAYATYHESDMGTNPALTEGEAATPGLSAIAEAGRPTGTDEHQPGLVTELSDAEVTHEADAFTPEDTVEDPNDPMGEVPGAPPIAPGGAFEFEIEASPEHRLTLATMFVPSNDIFFAPGAEGIPLFEDGEPVAGDVTDHIDLWDAGTEENERPGFGGDDQAPAADPDAGPDEDGVVRRLADVDDGFDYPETDEAIQVTVTPREMMDDG